jgi:hypothetical protein
MTRENIEKIKLSRIPRAHWALMKLSTLDRMSMFCYKSNKVDFFFTFTLSSLKRYALDDGNHKSSQ